MKYPTKLIETSTHGNAASHLIKTLDKKPAPPKCTPIGISTIVGDISIRPDKITYKFRINDGPIEEIIENFALQSEFTENDTGELEKAYNLVDGISDGIAVYPSISMLQKFWPPDSSWLRTPDYVGGLNEDGVVNLLGHDINLEDTVVVVYGAFMDDITYFRVGKAIRNIHKVEVFPSDESYGGEGPYIRSYYGNLMYDEFYKYQKSKESEWVSGDPIVTLSCGGLPMTPLVPSKMSDVECGFVEFQIYGKSDEYDHYELINKMTFKVDDVSYSFNEVVYSDSGIPVNDGMLTITELDGSYIMSVCCTNNRTPVNVVFDDPMLVFEVSSNGPGPGSGIYPNWVSPSDGSLEAVLTPPAIAPFGASNQIGLHVPDRGVGELWGVVSINGISYGRVKLCNSSSETTFVVNGHLFHVNYREDYNMVITLGGRSGQIPVGQNSYTYYKIEIEFDTDPMYLNPTGVWYQTQGWSNPLNNNNFTTSLDMRTNKLTAFMKYVEYIPM